MKDVNSISAAKFAWLWLGLGLAGLLAVLFRESFVAGHVHFSNDGPYGMEASSWLSFPDVMTGAWYDLNSIGYSGGAMAPSLVILLRWALGPEGYAKFLVPVTLWVVGMSAWFYFRNRGLSALACVLGGLAAALNSEFFSTACWGVAAQVVAFGMCYLALGLVSANKAETRGWVRWARYVLAGLAVGMAVMEAADIGALFSLLVAAAVAYGALIEEGSLAARAGRAMLRTAVIALCAGFLAAQTVSSLVSTQIQGIAGTQQDSQTKAEKWNWATQWSMPKLEALGIIVPGLFGYRADTAEGSTYWGLVGCDPNLDSYFDNGRQPPVPGGLMRFIGSGTYAGVPVVIIALWAAAQALRRKDSVFAPDQRKYLWFWIAVVGGCLLLSFGRFAPFYRLIYALPYFSTIRNPVKYMHLLTFGLLILFGYGVDGLCRRYLAATTAGVADFKSRMSEWWAKGNAFDTRWIGGCLAALGLGLLAWLIYASSRVGLEKYLQSVQFDEPTARDIAGFSIRRVGWFVGWMALSTGLLALIMSGSFGGSRAKWGGLLLGGLLVADLSLANLRWISYWDINLKYASNPVVDMLRDRPYEHRVAILPFAPPNQQLSSLNQLYRIEWAQQLFPLFNIQSIDVVQMPRVPADLEAYEGALRCDQNTVYRLVRKWQLTNTRYLLGAAGYLTALNQQLDPGRQRFKVLANFEIAAKPGIVNPTTLPELTAVLKPTGEYALFEFTGALPRAKLYTHWQISTNDAQTLETLANPTFDPEQSVLVSAPQPASPASTNQADASAEFVSYSPQRINLKTRAGAPGVVLLNDKFDADWKVRVDGKPEPLFRCNFIMRGVLVPAGAHAVEFRYQPPSGLLYVTLAALGLAVVLALGLTLAGRPESANEQKVATAT